MCVRSWISLLSFKTCVGLFLLGGPLIAFAAETDDWIQPGEEKVRLNLGAYLTSFDTRLRVDNQEVGQGTEINLEDDLGLEDNETIFWAGVDWRFARRHRLTVAYFDFKRSSTATALDDLEIEDEIIPAGATVTTVFNLNIVPIAYSYSFIKKPKHELAGTIGLHWNTLELDIEGSAFLAGEGRDGKVSAEAIAPMPLLGIRYDYYATKQWYSTIHAEYFDVSISDDTFSFAGTISNLRLSTEYWFYNNFGAGIALNYFALDVDVNDTEWQGAIDYEYVGPQIFISGRF